MDKIVYEIFNDQSEFEVRSVGQYSIIARVGVNATSKYIMRDPASVHDMCDRVFRIFYLIPT